MQMSCDERHLPYKFERHSDNLSPFPCVRTIPTFLEDETDDSAARWRDMALWCDTCSAPTRNTKNRSATPTECPNAILSSRNSVYVIWLHRAPAVLDPGNLFRGRCGCYNNQVFRIWWGNRNIEIFAVNPMKQNGKRYIYVFRVGEIDVLKFQVIELITCARSSSMSMPTLV